LSSGNKSDIEKIEKIMSDICLEKLVIKFFTAF